jgi:hypothetical protein
VGDVRNTSSEPVYNLIVAAWEMDLGMFDIGREMLVTPGDIRLYAQVPEGRSVGNALQLRFSDASGVRWVRELDGRLREATDEERTRDENPKWGI